MDQQDKKLNIKFNILAIVCIILFCFALTPITLQNDTYYTIRIGELILNNGIDMQDHFSWHENLPYTYPHWAYDVGIYYIYHLGEISGVQDGGMLFIYISTVILSCILGILIYVSNKKISKDNLFSFILTLGAMYLLKDFIAARAQLLTFILFALTILFIETFLEKNKKRYLIYIGIISLIIANVHIAVWPFFFILFMPYIGEYFIACILELHIVSKIILKIRKDRINTLQKRLDKQKDIEKKKILEKKLEQAKIVFEKQKEIVNVVTLKNEEQIKNPYKLKIRKNSAVKWLILIVVICILMGLFTPLGDSPYTYLVKTMQGNTTKSISEHQPIVLYNSIYVMAAFTLVLAILIFTRTKITLKDLFMIAGLMFLTFMSRRQSSLFVLIVVPVVTKWIAGLIKKYDKDGSKEFSRLMVTWIGKIITLIFVILCCLVILGPKKNKKFIDETKYPVEASSWILENLDLENIKLYNEYNYGSYLLYRGIPVFIDSRADLYAPEFNKTNEEEGRDIFSDYMKISSITKYYEDEFEKYEITHVILLKNSKLNMFISRDENYKELYEDDYFAIYERNYTEVRN